MAEGRPMKIILDRIFQSILSSLNLKENWDFVFLRAMNTSIALAPWLIIVAYATPPVPIFKAMTNTRSRVMFINDDTIRKMNGSLELPTALKMADPILYNRSPVIPEK